MNKALMRRVIFLSQTELPVKYLQTKRVIKTKLKRQMVAKTMRTKIIG
jgi:putative hemolysin